jgi:hypothetical protein
MEVLVRLARFAGPEGIGFANSVAAVCWFQLARSVVPVVVEEGSLLWSFVYLVVRNLFLLVWLLGRPRRSKELEILVLRHEMAILRRQAAARSMTTSAGPITRRVECAASNTRIGSSVELSPVGSNRRTPSCRPTGVSASARSRSEAAARGTRRSGS